MKTTHELYKYALALLLALAGGVSVWGQERGDQYESVGNSGTSMQEVRLSTIPSSDKMESPENALNASNSDYATVATNETGWMIVHNPENIAITRIVFTFSRYYNYYYPEEITVSTSEQQNSGYTQIGNTRSFSWGSATINLNQSAQQYIRLNFEAGNRETRITSIRFYYEATTTAPTIRHKHAKWYEIREGVSEAAKDMDTFDDENRMFEMELSTGTYIQAAHTYIDTIYVHKGSTTLLTLPEIQTSENLGSIPTYQRWYSYRTDGTFRTNQTGSGVVYDLLTPYGNKTAYRFQNGYVGNPMTGTSYYLTDNLYQMNFYYPEDNEFETWFPNATDRDNNWYIVACDVSCYTDYTERFDAESSKNSTFYNNYTQNDPYEPTLSHRVLFYIVGVDGREGYATDQPGTSGYNWYNGYGRLKRTEYQGGTNTKSYLEEYDISFPYTRVSNKTNELVSLSKDARSFVIPDAAEHGTGSLSVSLVDNTAGIDLLTNSLSENDRIISFTYPNVRDDGTRYVDADNSKATILVTKSVGGTTYNIARYNLTFSSHTQLLTQSQIEELDNGTVSETNYWYFPERTPKYLRENYRLLTQLNWDYDPNVASIYGQTTYYPFPLNWGHSSYAFYDGSEIPNNGNSDYRGQKAIPQWGCYGILSTYVEVDNNWDEGYNQTPPANKGKGSSNYHMYIDASDRPGVVARLPFDDPLCAGSELFVSAWVKSAGTSAEKSNDAAMLFTIMGVKTEMLGGRTVTSYTPIYRHSTGQIRTSYLLDGSIPGCGGKNNEWFQVYFSFINNSETATEFDSYVLQIDNNCASTDGGDMYLDDVQVYIATPNAEVNQLEANCSNELTRMNIKLDWDRLLSRTGGIEGSQETAAIDFCFIDQLKYNQYIDEKASNPQNPSSADIEAALEYAAETIGDGEVYENKFATLYYYLKYEENKDYDSSDLPGDGPLAKNNVDEQGNHYAYRLTEDYDVWNLAVDFYATLSPNRLYWLLINVTNGEKEPAASDFIGFRDDCAIRTEFRVTSLNLIKVNGEILNPGNDFCAGQHFDFSVDLRIPVTDESGEREEYINVSEGVNFDWFFGDEEEFLTDLHSGESYDGVSLAEALQNFREFYPTSKVIDETLTPVNSKVVDNQTIEFTQAMFDIIHFYVNEQKGEGLHNRLVLCEQALPITLLESGLDLVIKPIRTELPPEALNGIITEDQWALVCWDYIVLSLEATGEAPVVYPGFNEIQYADNDLVPNVRIGLVQMRKLNTENNTLEVSLRDATVVTTGASHIGLIEDEKDAAGNPYMLYLYLTDTDDPEMKKWLEPISDPDDPLATPSFDQYSLPVGQMTDLHAEPYELNRYTSYMRFYFDFEGRLAKVMHLAEEKYHDFVFKPKEGYTYTFTIHFKEIFDNENESSNACFGIQNFKFIVVPEYLVWNDQETGIGKIGNWNNDNNWRRVTDKEALKKTDDSFLEGNTNEKGYVPMLFSKVIMPRNSKVELYAAGLRNNIWETELPQYSHIGSATENIEYDLMVFEDEDSKSTTKPYRVALCDQIHFEPGAEMLHAEYLLYDTAWVDYELDGGRWYTLASPLQGVVAGDFYTDNTGKEESEYFKDITYSTRDNNRFSPSVYQRGWKPSGATLQTLSNDTKEVAVVGNWSSVYNNVAESYDTGTGFSLKVQDIKNGENRALFRLPKADNQYYYFNYNNGSPTQGSDSESVNRMQPGRLKSDVLYNRNTNLDDAEPGKPITVSLTEENGTGYYLVENPFMAHLDMEAFFNENSNLQQTYWLVDNNSQTVATGNAEDLTSNDPQADVTVAPLQSFFVKLAESEGTAEDVPQTVTFTRNMQVLGDANDGLRSSTDVLYLSATTSDGRTSRAAVAYDGAASAEYVSGEDAELFLDSNLGDVPMVYTVAGTMATSINRTSQLADIPVGLYGRQGETATLAFEGLDSFSGATLYDAQEGTETLLYDGRTVTVPARTSGRYFLRLGAATDNKTISARKAILIYTVGRNRVVVSSDGEPLQTIRVYNMAGSLVRQERVSGMQYEFTLPAGIYIVSAEDRNGMLENVKVRVR